MQRRMESVQREYTTTHGFNSAADGRNRLGEVQCRGGALGQMLGVNRPTYNTPVICGKTRKTWRAKGCSSSAPTTSLLLRTSSMHNGIRSSRLPLARNPLALDGQSAADRGS